MGPMLAPWTLLWGMITIAQRNPAPLWFSFHHTGHWSIWLGDCLFIKMLSCQDRNSYYKGEIFMMRIHILGKLSLYWNTTHLSGDGQSLPWLHVLCMWRVLNSKNQLVYSLRFRSMIYMPLAPWAIWSGIFKLLFYSWKCFSFWTVLFCIQCLNLILASKKAAYS